MSLSAAERSQGCECPTPPWHTPGCPALPGIIAADEAAAVAKAAAAEAQWAARDLASKYRCQALKFEGHRCANVITCTVTTGEWLEITVWNMADEIDFTEVIRVDGKPFGGNPDGILIPGDMVLINTVIRAWCGECAEEERKESRGRGGVLIITPLADGDYIPSGSSRYCANGYNNAACDDLCGPKDHSYQGERVQWWSASAQATVYGTVTGHGLGEFDRPWVTVRQDDGTVFSFWRSQVRPVTAPPASQLATNVRAAIGLKF